MAKMVTIKDVAKAAGVSPMTVSRVLNNRPDVAPKTRRRVQDIIAELGYAPSAIARSLSQGRSNTIGVVSSDLEFYGPSRTLVGIEQQANEFGYALMVRLLHNPLTDGGEDVIHELLANQVAGIIWAVAEIGDRREWLYKQRAGGLIPIVFLSMQPRSEMSVVAVDNYQGGCLAAHHLLQQGYDPIGMIAGPQAWWEARERERGWRDMLIEAGRQDPEALIERGDWTAAGGFEALQRLLTCAPNLEAIFAANDSMALGALQAAANSGRSVPDDLAVVGYDDVPESAYFMPPMTTVHQDLLQVGRRAVTQLHGQLQYQQQADAFTAEVTIIEPKLIVRKSSIRETS
ncbi:MAG: LacI family DNA-binding transcriptional regulator [Candidatus Promineifilaceae bacterium]|nr:LacI family DNA-binding transcriptional regulator [Candidatus Promineifilaceae bacterium]